MPAHENRENKYYTQIQYIHAKYKIFFFSLSTWKTEFIWVPIKTQISIDLLFYIVK